MFEVDAHYPVWFRPTFFIAFIFKVYFEKIYTKPLLAKTIAIISPQHSSLPLNPVGERGEYIPCSYLHSLLPRDPEIAPGEEAGDRVAGQVVDPALVTQLRHDRVDPRKS